MNAAPRIAIACITPSLTNPRKRFDEAQLAELTDSVKRHDVLQPILLRPNGKEGHYELVAGERRFRAAKAAGLVDIPATVRELSDTDVLEIQVVENLQREDLHELEEAEGYEKLLKCTHANGEKYTVEEIAAKVGKSRSYVFARLKLCALCPEARKAFYAGDLDASRALLIARIGHHDTQRQALKDVTKRPIWRWPDVLPRGAPAHPAALHAEAEKGAVRHEGRAARGEGWRLRPVPEAHRQPGRSLRRREECRRLHGSEVLRRQAPGALLVAAAELEAKGKKVIYGDEAKKAFPIGTRSTMAARSPERPLRADERPRLGGNRQPRARGAGRGLRARPHPAPGHRQDLRGRDEAGVEAAAKSGNKSARKVNQLAAGEAERPPDIDEVLTERLAKLIHKKAPKEFAKAWYLTLASSWSST
jgi:ParB/RepB/Spo0J family partition protein